MTDSPVLPHSLESEWGLISTLVRYPQRWYDVGDWLTPEKLFDTRSALIYGAIGEIVATNGTCTWQAIKALLEQRGDWTRIGDQHAAQIMRHGAINEPLLQHTAETIYDLAITRDVMLEGKRLYDEGFSAVENRRDWYSAASSRIDKVTAVAAKKTGASAKETITGLFAGWQNPEKATWSIGTGIPRLDLAFRKMRPKQLIVVAAHSGLGKSALAANWAEHVSVNETVEGLACGVYIQSAEMTREEYCERLVFSRARVDTKRLDKGMAGMGEDEWRAVVAAAQKLAVERLYIDDRPSATVEQIWSEARRVKLRFEQADTPLRKIIIDYAQIVTDEGRSREEEVARVSRESKQMAKDLDAVVTLMSQLNKESTKEKRRPRASDTRESAGIEADADKLVLIYNPSYHARASAYRKDDEPLGREFVELIVAKNRGAPVETVPATFWPSYTRFGPFDGTEEDLEELAASGEGGKRRSA